MIRNKKGFTLVELLVVIAVLAILTAIAIPSYVYLIKKHKFNIMEKEAEQIYDASDLLKDDFISPPLGFEYPENTQEYINLLNKKLSDNLKITHIEWNGIFNKDSIPKTKGKYISTIGTGTSMRIERICIVNDEKYVLIFNTNTNKVELREKFD